MANPDALYDNKRSPKKKFDPEGDDYDYETAKKAGLGPKPVDDDDVPHWPSRDPRTGMLLKGRKHKTFDKGVEEDEKLGYKMKKKGDRYYTLKDKPEQSEPVDPETLADDAGDQSPSPNNPSEKLRALAK